MRFATTTVVVLVFVIIGGLFAYRASETLAYTKGEGKMPEVNKNTKAYYEQLYKNSPIVTKTPTTAPTDSSSVDTVQTQGKED